MRNTYNAMVEAAGQLTLRSGWLDGASNQRELSVRLAWPVQAPAKVHSCVALGNRVFNGYTCKGHPVRQVHEMFNVLLRGAIEFSDGHHVRVSAAETFAASDLVAYLKGTTTHADFPAAMLEFDLETPIGDQRLIFPTFGLDLAELKETVPARYPAVP